MRRFTLFCVLLSSLAMWQAALASLESGAREANLYLSGYAGQKTLTSKTKNFIVNDNVSAVLIDIKDAGAPYWFQFQFIFTDGTKLVKGFRGTTTETIDLSKNGNKRGLLSFSVFFMPPNKVEWAEIWWGGGLLDDTINIWTPSGRYAVNKLDNVSRGGDDPYSKNCEAKPFGRVQKDGSISKFERLIMPFSGVINPSITNIYGPRQGDEQNILRKRIQNDGTFESVNVSFFAEAIDGGGAGGGAGGGGGGSGGGGAGGGAGGGGGTGDCPCASRLEKIIHINSLILEEVRKIGYNLKGLGGGSPDDTGGGSSEYSYNLADPYDPEFNPQDPSQMSGKNLTSSGIGFGTITFHKDLPKGDFTKFQKDVLDHYNVRNFLTKFIIFSNGIAFLFLNIKLIIA